MFAVTPLLHRPASLPALPWPRIANANAQTKALRFASVVDGTGRLIPNGVVIIDGDKITRIAGPRDALPANAQVIDLSRYTAIPGMIDLHTHMTYAYWDPDVGHRSVASSRRASPSRRFQLATRQRAAHARSGRHIGARSRLVELHRHRDARLGQQGGVVGPRMFVAGYGLQRARPPFRAGTDTTRTTRGRVFNISQVAEAVKQQVDAGADYIKMYGVDRQRRRRHRQRDIQLRRDERPPSTRRTSIGKRIAIHSYGPEGGHDVVMAGANSLEHAIDLDDATLAEMVKRGNVYYVPTIDHNRYYAEYAADFHYTPQQVAALDSFRLRNFETARRAFKAGVKMGMGSDAVFHMFGQNTRELGWMVKLGMTPAQALATATTNGAEILGMEKSLGRIAPGYFADIVAVDGRSPRVTSTS